MSYGPIVVDDTSGKFVVTSLGAPATVSAQIASDLTPPVVVVPPPPPPPPPPPVTGAITWQTIPHILNDWTVAGQVTFGAHQYYVESANSSATPDSWAAQLSTNTTTPIFRGECRNGALWTSADGGNDTERSELDGSATQLYPKSTEMWLSYQFMVEPGLPMIAGVVKPSSPGDPGGPLSWGVVGQVHGDGSKNQAAVPWSLNIASEKIVIETQHGAQIGTDYPVKALVRGQVYSVVARMKITGDKTSTMTTWVDGVQVASSTNVVIGGPDLNNYVKAGLYRGSENDGFSPLAVQVANLEHGTANLMARVASPLPWPTTT